MTTISTTLKPARRKQPSGRNQYLSARDQHAERKPESSAEFFYRLRSYLGALAKIETKLSPKRWRAFLRAYSQHWLYSVEHREIATKPDVFLAEWTQIQGLGVIPMDTTNPGHERRDYDIARRALGFED